MPNNLRRRRTAQVLMGTALSLAAFGLVSVYVWTAPMGWAWHLLHGNFASFEGKKIRVPWDCFVSRSEDGGLTIWRPGAKYAPFRSTAGMMFIHRPGHGLAPDLSKEYETITSRMTSANISTGYALQAVRKVATPNGFGYCWEFMSFDLKLLDITCLFDRDTLSLSYKGSPVYGESFYSAVEELSKDGWTGGPGAMR